MKTYTKHLRPADALDAHGKLKLRITGFGEQKIVDVASIVRAIDRLPSFHLEGLREIAYAPWELSWDAFDYYEGHVPGRRKAAFKQRERRIVVYEFDTAPLFYQLLYHEIGHFVFFLAISSIVKKRWVTEVYPGSACISAYGARNAIEDFAESYACFVRDPESLKKIPEKYSYMRNSIFSGKPETRKETRWMPD